MRTSCKPDSGRRIRRNGYGLTHAIAKRVFPRKTDKNRGRLRRCVKTFNLQSQFHIALGSRIDRFGSLIRGGRFAGVPWCNASAACKQKGAYSNQNGSPKEADKTTLY